MTKPTKWHMRPAMTQISLGIRPVWSESSLSAWRKLGSLATHWAHSEDSDQTGRMPRLIWVFVGRTATLLVLSWGGSNYTEGARVNNSISRNEFSRKWKWKHCIHGIFLCWWQKLKMIINEKDSWHTKKTILYKILTFARNTYPDLDQEMLLEINHKLSYVWS